ncbi:hypothetical protein M7I_4222 [Glarea lozoyensis 74030]|uniref:Uncharacterized protein n=1 Tax=Glarea lozoyensis (strain ATCC 74030 / MF5533) TaxID=1104152 RepID=H0ENL4_GLAL7|nr:hypothetical protein M7I_4222 [Glarea lozoyensis 74030]
MGGASLEADTKRKVEPHFRYMPIPNRRSEALDLTELHYQLDQRQ